jgi:hypothetical protein
MAFRKVIQNLISLPGIALLLVGLLFSLDAFGQLQLYPVQRKAPVSKRNSNNPNARIKAEILTLPFWDDFSFTPVDDPTDTTSNYPLDSLWENSNSTWITSSGGINAPSSNVATFDGVDSIGISYSDQTLANGFRDKLVSRPIDLSGTPSNIFLSFRYQWRGNGEPPDKNDFLQLEFLSKGTVDTAWIPIITIYPKTTFERDVFYDTIVQVVNIDDERYLYKGFQFRFRSYGRESGPFDTWHVDYVYLNSGRSLLDIHPPDIAIASTLPPIFDQYYAVPFDIFRRAPFIDTVFFDIQSLRTEDLSRNYRLSATFTDYIGNTTEVNESIVVSNENVGQAVNHFERYRIKTHNVPDTTSDVLFNPLADSIRIDYKINLQTATDADPVAPVNYAINDTITKTYFLNNYYAYDDGSAEYSGALTTPGNRIAIAFDIASEGNEKLAGIDIYCPAFRLGESAIADFYIYADNNGKPGDNPIYTLPNKSIKRLGLNQFQRIIIASSENVLVSERFYIGWKAPSGELFHVGVDYSNDTSDKIFTKNTSNDEWTVDKKILGSMMIRPLFGESVGVPTGIEKGLEGVSLYPNPSRGEFYVEGRADIVTVINMKGQRVPFEVSLQENRKRVSLQNFAPGIYLVRLQQGKNSGIQKILITH